MTSNGRIFDEWERILKDMDLDQKVFYKNMCSLFLWCSDSSVSSKGAQHGYEGSYQTKL
jgi:hypothetical protein